MGVGASVAAVAHGASVIEKHFTLNRADGGVDSTFSLEPSELQSLVVETERAWQSLGEVVYGAREDEKKNLIFRRSLYFTKDLSLGEVVTADNIKIIRPGYGVSPKYLEIIIGRKVNRSVKKGAAVSWELLN